MSKLKDTIRRYHQSTKDFDDILNDSLYEDPTRRDRAMQILMKHNDAIEEVQNQTLKQICELFGIPQEE